MKVHIIKLLADNYSYLVIPPISKMGWLVDPAIKKPVMDYLEQQEYKNTPISRILVTHKHWDHCGETGQLVEQLAKRNTMLNMFQPIEVMTGLEDKQTFTTISIQTDTTYQIEGLTLQAIKAPCHTRGHTLYRLQTLQQQQQQHDYSDILFTGDTLFSSGCGRFFEGSAEEMLVNMNKISELPLETKIFCGHEYTLANLQWSLQVLPNHTHLQSKIQHTQTQLAKGLTTMPTDLATELNTNLFMMTNQSQLQKLLQVNNPTDCMDILRQMKNANKAL